MVADKGVRGLVRMVVSWAVALGATKEDLRQVFEAVLEEVDQVKTPVEIPGGDYKVLDQGAHPGDISDQSGGTGVTPGQDQGDEDHEPPRGSSLEGGSLRSGDS